MFKVKLKGLILIVLVQSEDKRRSTFYSPPNVSTLVNEVKQNHKEDLKDKCLENSDIGHLLNFFPRWKIYTFHHGCNIMAWESINDYICGYKCDFLFMNSRYSSDLEEFRSLQYCKTDVGRYKQSKWYLFF